MSEGEDELRARNLEQLLQRTIAIQQQSSGDSPQPAAAATGQISPEDAAWLSQAMGDIFSDPVKEMIRVVAQLQHALATPGSDHDLIAQLLQVVSEYAADLNVANDFFKVQGCDLLTKCLKHDSAEVRGSACQLIGDLTQNNPTSQSEIICHPSLFEDVLSLLKDKNQPANVRVSAFYALSSTLRDCPEAQQSFLQRGGAAVLLMALRSDVPKLRLKTAFFISSMLDWQSKVYSDLENLGVVEQLCGLLCPEHDPAHEHVLAALLRLAEARPESVPPRLRDNRLGLASTLDAKLSWIESQQDKEKFEEESQYARQLLKLLHA